MKKVVPRRGHMRISMFRCPFLSNPDLPQFVAPISVSRFCCIRAWFLAMYDIVCLWFVVFKGARLHEKVVSRRGHMRISMFRCPFLGVRIERLTAYMHGRGQRCPNFLVVPQFVAPIFSCRNIAYMHQIAFLSGWVEKYGFSTGLSQARRWGTSLGHPVGGLLPGLPFGAWVVFLHF